LSLRNIAFSPRIIINLAIQTMSILAKDKGIVLKTEIAEDIPAAVKGDSLRLRQVLLNLLSNAIKFTTRGSVTLKLSIVPDNNKKATLHCAISDTGIGIESDKLKNIFGPFHPGRQQYHKTIWWHRSWAYYLQTALPADGRRYSGRKRVK